MSLSDNDRVDPGLAAGNRVQLTNHTARHFQWQVSAGVGTLTLNRPERKNPLTFDSYAELRDTFRELHHTPEVKVVVITGAAITIDGGTSA